MYLHLNIKHLRNAKNITQAQFADMLNISRKNISNYEQERAKPPIELAIKMSQILGVSLEDMVEKDFSNKSLSYETSILKSDLKSDLTSDLNIKESKASYNKIDALEELQVYVSDLTKKAHAILESAVRLELAIEKMQKEK